MTAPGRRGKRVNKPGDAADAVKERHSASDLG